MGPDKNVFKESASKVKNEALYLMGTYQITFEEALTMISVIDQRYFQQRLMVAASTPVEDHPVCICGESPVYYPGKGDKDGN